MINLKNNAIWIIAIVLLCQPCMILYGTEKTSRFDSPIAQISAVKFSVYEDNTSGTFEIDTDNDPPTYSSWYDSTTLIEPFADVLFYVVFVDIDNSSSDFTVTLWYSNDTFGAYNDTQTLSFSTKPSANTYRFTYLFAGQSVGTYFQYYYTVNDGASTIYQPEAYQSGIFFDIQWDNPPEGDPAGVGTPSDDGTTTTVGVVPYTPPSIDAIQMQLTLMTFLLVGLLIVGIKTYMDRRNKIDF